ncbi:uncharacterized protein LOC122503473 [Leptopilina heterotoma]|uniref:uncharacterized protein LOC122503473 n=1 Tax=Leptopilina heterotoma TaxID=63436 RepID=UPI001CA7D55E|nr:uncharacterized protein LOC122503473 [Leptopilina heterotoma]
MGRSTYKKPMLRKGALPALLLGKPEKPQKSRLKRFRLEDENMNDEVSTKRGKMNEDNTDNQNNNQEKSHENVIIDNNPSDPSDGDDSQSEDLFSKIINSNNSYICLPISWGKTVFYWNENKDKLVNFHKLIARKDENGEVETFSEREFTIDDKLTLHIKINGVKIDHTRFGIQNNVITSIDMLKDTIKIIDECKICQGCRDIAKTPENGLLLENFTYIDKLNNLRHSQCSLLLTDEKYQNNACKCCKSVKHLLHKKIIRRQHCKNTKYLNLKNLSPKRKEQVLKLKRLKASEGKAKKRAQDSNRSLKKIVQKCQIKMNNMSANSLETLMNNKKLSPNEKTTLQEILKASKTKNAKGRRYSDGWIILCLLMQTKSPATYRMIRDLKILPLPHERTIRKYLLF